MISAKMKRIYERLKSGVRRIPIIGPLSICSKVDLKDAFFEVLIATVFSTMPLWLLPLLSLQMFSKPISVSEAIRTGELFLLSAALVGPLVYIITRKYGEKDSNLRGRHSLLKYSIYFPDGNVFVFISIGICLVSSFAFYVLRNPSLGSFELDKMINYGGVVKLSYAIFGVSTFIFFCASACRNSLASVPLSLPNDEISFVKQWESEK